MPTREDLKRSVAEEIDRRGEELVRVAKTILEHPEAGFRETRTAAVVDRVMGEMGVQRRTGIAITGSRDSSMAAPGPGRRWRCWASWTRCLCRGTPTRTRRRGRRTPAGTTRRSR